MVIARTPLVAFSISRRLKRRNIRTFGNTHKVIECVIICVSTIRPMYDCKERWLCENAKKMIPTIKGRTSPAIKPTLVLSNFTVKFIF
jgi:hypothetical protein